MHECAKKRTEMQGGTKDVACMGNNGRKEMGKSETKMSPSREKILDARGWGKNLLTCTLYGMTARKNLLFETIV